MSKLTVGTTDYQADPLSLDDLRRFDAWIRQIVRGAMECRFEAEMVRAMNEPHALRVLLEMVTDCTPEAAVAAITESTAAEWSRRLEPFLSPPTPQVFTGSAAEQQAAVEQFLRERDGR
jgi:hypothetical protein